MKPGQNRDSHAQASDLKKCSTWFLERMYHSKILDCDRRQILEILSERKDVASLTIKK